MMGFRDGRRVNKVMNGDAGGFFFSLSLDLTGRKELVSEWVSFSKHVFSMVSFCMYVCAHYTKKKTFVRLNESCTHSL